MLADPLRARARATATLGHVLYVGKEVMSQDVLNMLYIGTRVHVYASTEACIAWVREVPNLTTSRRMQQIACLNATTVSQDKVHVCMV